MDGYWRDFLESLWDPESWMKALILLVFAPIWFPTARAIVKEIIAAIKADQQRDLPPGEDPFLNVPLAGHRRQLGQAQLKPAPRREPARGSGGGSAAPARGAGRARTKPTGFRS